MNPALPIDGLGIAGDAVTWCRRQALGWRNTRPEIPVHEDCMIDLLSDRPAAAAGTLGPLVLDAQALALLAQLDPSGSGRLFTRVMSTYRASLARLIGQLITAREPFDPDSMRMAAHTLKSSSGSVGALRLSQLCGSAEAALRDRRFDALPPLLEALVAEAGRADLAVHQLLLSDLPDITR